MRIAFVTPEYITEKNFDGGLSTYLGRVCRGLLSAGHAAIVIVASDHDETFFDNGIEVHRVGTNRAMPVWLNRITLMRLQAAKHWIVQSWILNQVCSKLHCENEFDIIQYASFTATGIFRLDSVPCVVRLSSFASMWQKGNAQARTANNRLQLYLENLALRRADAVFGPSNVVAKAVTDETGLQVRVIESPFMSTSDGTDNQPFVDALRDKKYLLFFGTLSPKKGVATIAEVIEPLLTLHTDLHFVFVGKDDGHTDGPMIDHLWRKAGACRGRVLYLGQMRQSQLYPILAHADGVVLPSRFDNLPNACIEAMAFQRVVIGTTGASFEQLIEEGKSGFLVPIDSPNELLIAINHVLSLVPSEKAAIGASAAKRIDGLRPEITVAALIEFYRAVIQKKAGHSRAKAS